MAFIQRPAALRAEIIPPAAVTDLAAAPGENPGEISLSWHAPGNNGSIGPLLAGSSYFIQFATYSIQWSTANAQVLIGTDTVNPGDFQTSLLTGLIPGGTYFVYIWTSDDWSPPNLSLISNGATTYSFSIPPSVPSGFASSSGAALVDLSWSPNGEGNMDRYEIYYSSWSASADDYLIGILHPGTTHQHPGLINGNTYYYKIRAVSSSGYSNFTPAITAIPDVIVGVPVISTFTAVLSTDTIVWAWDLAANADGYRVFQSSSGQQLSADLGPAATYFVESGLPANSSHTVYVQAFSGQLTQNSATTGYYTLSDVPSSISSPSQSTSTIDLSWAPAGVSPTTRYDVERSTSGNGDWTLIAPLILATTAQDSGLGEFTTYYYRIFSYNGDGVKSASSTVFGAMTVDVPPAAISNLTASPGAADGSVQLVWTAPGDDGNSGNASSYVVKYATFDVTAANFDDASVITFNQTWVPKAPGLTEGVGPVLEVTGLYAGTTYYFAVKAADEAGERGSWSTAGVNSQRSAPAHDAVPPAPTGLGGTPGDHSVMLTWTPIAGLPDLDSYRIYRSSSPPYDAFELAGSTPSSFAVFTDTGLANQTTYVYKITAVDQGDAGDFFSIPFESVFSSTVSAATLDREPPAAVMDLSLSSGAVEGELLLSWSAPGDDAGILNVAGGRFRVDYSTDAVYVFSTSTYKVDVATSQTQGEIQSYVLTGLSGGATYFVRLWTWDEASNSAGLSNAATGWAQVDVTSPSAVGDLTAQGSWRRVTLRWSAPGDDGPAGALNGSFSVRYSTDGPITDEASFSTAPFQVSVATSVPAGAALAHTVTGLANGVNYYFAVRGEDERGNAGPVTALSAAQAPAVNTPPNAFSLLAPADGAATINPSPTFNWNPTTDADAVYGDTFTYVLEYSTVPAFDVGVATFPGIAAAFVNISPSVLAEDVTTYWRVRAVDADGGQTFASSVFHLALNQFNSAPSVFSLQAPADGSDVAVAQPTLIWTSALDPDPGDSLTYRVEYSSSEIFDVFTASAGLTSPQFKFSAPLTENGTYYWRAFAVDLATETLGVPATFHFRVDAVDSPPTAFSLIAPADGLRLTTTTVDFSWGMSTDPDPGDSVTYALVYSFLQNFASSTTVTGLASPAYSTTTLDNVAVYWFAEAQGNSGAKQRSNEPQNVFTIDLAKELPSSFTLLTPTGSAIVPVLKPLFAWTAAIDPDPLDSVQYSFELSDRADFLGVQGIPLTNTSYQVTNDLLDQTTYYWRVRAGGYRGAPLVLQDPSEIIVGTGVFVVSVVNSPPQTFALRQPADGSSVTTVRPTFVWDAAQDVDLSDVVSYTVVYSTMADLSGGQSVAGLSNPNYAAASPLLEDHTYYWKVVAQDIDGASTDSAQVFSFKVPVLTRPKAPASVRGSLSSDRTAYMLQWSAVEANMDGSAITDLGGYRVYRALSPSTIGDSAFLAQLSSDELTYIDPSVGGGEYFYAVRAVDTGGNESGNSLLVQAKADPVYVAVSEDKGGEVEIAFPASDELQKETNGRGEDLLVLMTRKADQETGNVLRCYELETRSLPSEKKLSGFLFKNPIKLSFAVNPPAASSPDARPALATAPELPPEQMSVYWFNGVEFVKFGGLYDSSKSVISLFTQRAGVYQLRKALQANSFEIVQTWPKKIFTPNGDGINDEMNFLYNNPKEVPVSGEIFTLKSAKVATLSPGKDGSSLLWNGKDDDGQDVPKGVYVYQIKADGKTYNGTVVVAR